MRSIYATTMLISFEDDTTAAFVKYDDSKNMEEFV